MMHVLAAAVLASHGNGGAPPPPHTVQEHVLLSLDLVFPSGFVATAIDQDGVLLVLEFEEWSAPAVQFAVSGEYPDELDEPDAGLGGEEFAADDPPIPPHTHPGVAQWMKALRECIRAAKDTCKPDKPCCVHFKRNGEDGGAQVAECTFQCPDKHGDCPPCQGTTPPVK